MLIISNPTKDDAGEYTVVAENKTGSFKFTVPVVVGMPKGAVERGKSGEVIEEKPLDSKAVETITLKTLPDSSEKQMGEAEMKFEAVTTKVTDTKVKVVKLIEEGETTTSEFTASKISIEPISAQKADVFSLVEGTETTSTGIIEKEKIQDIPKGDIKEAKVVISKEESEQVTGTVTVSELKEVSQDSKVKDQTVSIVVSKSDEVAPSTITVTEITKEEVPVIAQGTEVKQVFTEKVKVRERKKVISSSEDSSSDSSSEVSSSEESSSEDEKPTASKPSEKGSPKPQADITDKTTPDEVKAKESKRVGEVTVLGIEEKKKVEDIGEKPIMVQKVEVKEDNVIVASVIAGAETKDNLMSVKVDERSMSGTVNIETTEAKETASEITITEVIKPVDGHEQVLALAVVKEEKSTDKEKEKAVRKAAPSSSEDSSSESSSSEESSSEESSSEEETPGSHKIADTSAIKQVAPVVIEQARVKDLDTVSDITVSEIKKKEQVEGVPATVVSVEPVEERKDDVVTVSATTSSDTKENLLSVKLDESFTREDETSTIKITEIKEQKASSKIATVQSMDEAKPATSEILITEVIKTEESPEVQKLVVVKTEETESARKTIPSVESSEEESSSEESSSDEDTDKPKGQPPKFSQPPEPILVDVGGTIRLSCRVTGWRICQNASCYVTTG